MSEKQQQNQSQEYIWMRRQDPSVVVYEEDLEEKPDMILEQDFHVDLWIENLGFTLHITP